MKSILKKIHKNFEDLKFNEEDHKYFVKDTPLQYSVSGIIKLFHEPFKREAISRDKEIEFNTLKELGCIPSFVDTSQKAVLASWDAKSSIACEKGTDVHLFGEKYPFDRTLKPKNKKEEAIVKFWESLPSHIVPAIMELQMFHKKYMFAGTADILLFNTKTKKFIIGDYKTNEDLFNTFGNQVMKKGFSDLSVNAYNKYQLQLSFYQILFEQTGYEVSGRKLIWLLPDGNYKMYSTNDYTNRLNNFLANYKLN